MPGHLIDQRFPRCGQCVADEIPVQILGNREVERVESRAEERPPFEKVQPLEQGQRSRGVAAHGPARDVGGDVFDGVAVLVDHDDRDVLLERIEGQSGRGPALAAAARSGLCSVNQFSLSSDN